MPFSTLTIPFRPLLKITFKAGDLSIQSSEGSISEWTDTKMDVSEWCNNNIGV